MSTQNQPQDNKVNLLGLAMLIASIIGTSVNIYNEVHPDSGPCGQNSETSYTLSNKSNFLMLNVKKKVTEAEFSSSCHQ